MQTRPGGLTDVAACHTTRWMTPVHFIFDLDGTLLDTLQDIADCANWTMAAHGYPTHETSSYRLRVGEGVRTLILRSLPEDRRDPATIDRCVAVYRDEYSRNWDLHTRPYAGVCDMLDELTRRGARMAVLSNKPDEFTHRCVSKFLPRWNFDVVLGATAHFPHKPDPASALEVARRMNVEPGSIVYLGDSAIDMLTAVAAGMYPVGALWGFRDRAELESAGAKALISRPVELLGVAI